MEGDVVDLKRFYETRLGLLVARTLRRHLRVFWPDMSGQRMLGLGYAVPFLRPFRDEAERVVALMPARQGVHHWPAGDANAVALADDTELPLPDAMFDRVLLVHALETSEEMRPMLREIWRVLAPEGRLLIVAPNRSGVWSRLERTPFGAGQPFSHGQLERLLREAMFSPTQSSAALYFPPTRWNFALRLAGPLENFGARIKATALAGAVLVEASKQVYAVGVRAQGRRRRPVAVPAIRLVQRGAARVPGHAVPDVPRS